MHYEFQKKISALEKAGLNLFCSIPAIHLNNENKIFLKKYAIELDEKDVLCLVAHGGRTLWEKLPAPPIDDYSVEQIKNSFSDARILFPGHQLYPLQQIGRMMNMGRPSPIGIDLNEDFGPWFAYRCLFITREPIPQRMFKDWVSACLSCKDKSCLLYNDFYQARSACPYKAEHRYSDEQLRYHKSQLP